MNKSNADHLRQLINSDSYDKDEALEFITAMEEEIQEAEQAYRDIEVDKNQLEREIGEWPKLTKVFLGLDTLHYYLENKNLKITQQLESWISEVKEQNSATINS